MDPWTSSQQVLLDSTAVVAVAPAAFMLVRAQDLAALPIRAEAGHFFGLLDLLLVSLLSLLRLPG